MTRVAIVVEGETEEEFIKTVLAPHLRTREVESTPHLVGGNITVQRLASEMANLFWSYDRVTSLVDFYGFQVEDQVSREELETLIHDQVNHRIKRSWDQSRVFPYVQQYEFEGLLFSDVTTFGKLLDAPADLVEKLSAVRSGYATPEEINDGKETHPSKRIQDLMPSYQKRVHGPFIAGSMGLSMIRAECPRFGRWIARLERLENQTARSLE